MADEAGTQRVRLRMMLPLLLVGPLLALAGSIREQETPAPQATSTPGIAVESFPEHALEVRLPESLAASREKAQDALLCEWKGTLASSSAELSLFVIDVAEYGLEEPEDANETWIDDLNSGGPEASYAFDLVECLPVDHGWARHVALSRGRARSGAGPPAVVYLVSGLGEERAWTLRAELATEPASDADAKIREALVAAVRSAEPARDTKWSDAELRWRWLRSAPEATVEKLGRPARTEHYVVLTDDTHGPALAKKLEGLHASFAKLLAIPEVPTRKLLPVYLFRTDQEYQAYYARSFDVPVEEAQWRRGHLEGIYYVTFFEDLDHPIHLHYAALQILHARLRFQGGGAWFQAGIAEYLSTRPAQRNRAAKRVVAGEHMPLALFLRETSFARVTEKEERKGTDVVEPRLEQAALWIEFLADSPFAKDRFPELARKIGPIEDGDAEAVETALRAVYGVEVPEIERRWIEYCKKR